MKRDSPSADVGGGGGGGGGGDAPVRKGKSRRIKKIKVDHTYRDFSRLSLESVSLQLRLAGQDVGGDYVGSKTMSFPRKLYEMVTNPQYQHIIRFMPHGRSWVVLDKEALVSEVLPKYFNHSKFESFNRQVNGWGYKRLLKQGPDHKSYYHECFLRGRPELTTLMIRLVNPGKRLPDLEGEPDFYAISERNPLPEIGELAFSVNNATFSSGWSNNLSSWSTLWASSMSTPHMYHQASLHPSAPSQAPQWTQAQYPFQATSLHQASLHLSAPSQAPQWTQAQYPFQATRLHQAPTTQAPPSYQQGMDFSLQGTVNFSSRLENQPNCQGMSNTSQFAPSQEFLYVESTANAMPSFHDCLEKPSHSKLPVTKNSHSVESKSSNNISSTFSVDDSDNNIFEKGDIFDYDIEPTPDNDIFEKGDIFDYDIEPTPLSESPLKINPYFTSMEEYLSNIKKPGPLLEDFAGICFSKGQNLSDSIHK